MFRLLNLIIFVSAFSVFQSQAFATGEMCLVGDNQVNTICSLACEMNKSYGTPVSPEACGDTVALVNKFLNGKAAPFFAQCVASGGEAVWENLKDLFKLFSPSEFRAFLSECDKSLDCKFKLARQMPQYDSLSDDALKNSLQDKDGKSKVAIAEFVLGFQHTQSVLADECSAALGRITRDLSNELSEAETLDQQVAVQQKRYDLVVKYNARCADVIGFSRPTAESVNAKPKPLNQVLGNYKDSAMKSTESVASEVVSWLDQSKIAIQCASEADQAKVICYGVARAFLDPVKIAAAAGLTAAAIKITRGGKAIVVENMERRANVAREVEATRKELEKYPNNLTKVDPKVQAALKSIYSEMSPIEREYFADVDAASLKACQ